MQTYTVTKLASLSGVSVRTLHHYDKIGLLKPTVRTEAKYRLYGEAELLRLQQILFYKELDISLKEIDVILNAPDFEIIRSLQQHRIALLKRKQRISTLLTTIDKTIIHLANEKNTMKPEELYEGLPKETIRKYQTEAIEAYGQKVIEKSENALMKLSKEQLSALRAEQKINTENLFSLQHESPTGDRVQEMIAQHYKIVRMFWGTSNSPDKQADAYIGLGKLYESDERFTLVGQKAQPIFAAFLKRAMEHFAKTQLS